MPPPPPLPSPGPPAAISCPASRNQRCSVPGPRNAGPTVPIRLKASALAVAVHWTLRRCHLRLSRRCVGRWRWFASNFPGSHSPFVHFWVGPLIIPALHPNSPSAPVLSAGFRVEDFCPLPTPTPDARHVNNIVVTISGSLDFDDSTRLRRRPRRRQRLETDARLKGQRDTYHGGR